MKLYLYDHQIKAFRRAFPDNYFSENKFLGVEIEIIDTKCTCPPTMLEGYISSCPKHGQK